MKENSNEDFKVDLGRTAKTGSTTGIAGIAPAFGYPSKSVSDAIGALFVGVDASAINAIIEVLVTKLLE